MVKTKPELIVIKEPYEILDLNRYLQEFNIVAFDTETTGLTQQDRIIGFSVCSEASKAYYVIITKENSDQAKDILGLLSIKDVICHNGVFDCMMVESNYKLNLIHSLHTDTMILAHLLNENRRVGLKELGSAMYGDDIKAEADIMKASILANGGSVTKGKYELYKADPQLIGKYGAKDAWITFMLFNDLIPELVDQNLVNFFYEESMPLLRGPTYSLNTVGLQVDTKNLSTLKSTLKAECAEAKSFILSEINNRIKDIWPGTTKSNTFNMGSNQQLSRLLFGVYKLDYGKLTKGGKTVCKALGLRLPYTPSARREFIAVCEQKKNEVYQPEALVNGKLVKAKKIKDVWGYIACDKEILKKLSPKYKWIERLLEHQRKLKLLNTYVEGMEERIQYGIIRPSFLQHGTTSGRYASRMPNFQNLPRDDKRIKECIVARPGRVFVGADYSQLEPRVFSYFSNDSRLREAFNGESDFYSVIGIGVYDKPECLPLKEGQPMAFGVLYPKLRQDAKTFTLAATYGATGAQLAPLMGKSSDDAQRDINDYFEKFPKVKEMMLESHEMAKTRGQVTNLFGRPRRMPDALKITKLFGKQSHAELPYEARNLLNLAVNHRIQSTAASIVNRAAIRFHRNAQERNINCKLVLQVHDSLVIECNESDAQTVSLLLEDAMVNTTLLEGVRLEAHPKIGKNLAQI